ncbi:MAG: hypothetical protein DMG13_00180 [Acidobacteria bacterium]|nr:MAG: hypothetical protein DMG13_00180 [Acidobacteriota bacterium]
MRRVGYLGLSLFLILALGAPAFSQQAQARTPAEYNAYVAFYNEQNPQKKAELGEKFLAENKDSDFVPQGYQMLIGAYARAQNWAKVMDAAERTAALPKAEDKLKAFAYANAMVAAQQTNNFDKTVEYGDKVLAIEPNDLNAMVVLATTIPERLPPNEAAKKAAMEKAAALATKALEGVKQFFTQPKPPNVPEPQWNQQRADLEGQLHAALGFIAFNRQDYANAAQEFQTAFKSTPKDGVSHYRLGLVFQTQASAASKALLEAINAENDAKKARRDQPVIDELVAKRQGIETDAREKRDKAIDELATSVAIGGVVAQPARDALERLYKVKNNDSLEGLDQLIAQKKSQVGQ